MMELLVWSSIVLDFGVWKTFTSGCKWTCASQIHCQLLSCKPPTEWARLSVNCCCFHLNPLTDMDLVGDGWWLQPYVPLRHWENPLDFLTSNAELILKMCDQVSILRVLDFIQIITFESSRTFFTYKLFHLISFETWWKKKINFA